MQGNSLKFQFNAFSKIFIMKILLKLGNASKISLKGSARTVHADAHGISQVHDPVLLSKSLRKSEKRSVN